MLDLWIGETVNAIAQVLSEFKIASITDGDEAYFIAHVGNASLVAPESPIFTESAYWHLLRREPSV